MASQHIQGKDFRHSATVPGLKINISLTTIIKIYALKTDKIKYISDSFVDVSVSESFN